VHIVCLEGEDCMVAPPDDLVQAREEGSPSTQAAWHPGCWNKTATRPVWNASRYPVFLLTKPERLESKRQAAKEDPSGDTVILAVGVKPELGFLKGTGIVLNPNGTIKTDAVTLATSAKGSLLPGTLLQGHRLSPAPSARVGRPPWRSTVF